MSRKTSHLRASWSWVALLIESGDKFWNEFITLCMSFVVIADRSKCTTITVTNNTEEQNCRITPFRMTENMLLLKNCTGVFFSPPDHVFIVRRCTRCGHVQHLRYWLLKIAFNSLQITMPLITLVYIHKDYTNIKQIKIKYMI